MKRLTPPSIVVSREITNTENNDKTDSLKTAAEIQKEYISSVKSPGEFLQRRKSIQEIKTTDRSSPFLHELQNPFAKVPKVRRPSITDNEIKELTNELIISKVEHVNSDQVCSPNRRQSGEQNSECDSNSTLNHDPVKQIKSSGKPSQNATSAHQYSTTDHNKSGSQRQRSDSIYVCPSPLLSRRKSSAASTVDTSNITPNGKLSPIAKRKSQSSVSPTELYEIKHLTVPNNDPTLRASMSRHQRRHSSGLIDIDIVTKRPQWKQFNNNVYPADDQGATSHRSPSTLSITGRRNSATNLLDPFAALQFPHIAKTRSTGCLLNPCDEVRALAASPIKRKGVPMNSEKRLLARTPLSKMKRLLGEITANQTTCERLAVEAEYRKLNETEH